MVYLAVDAFLTPGGKPVPELVFLLHALAERNTPVVLVSARSRQQLDDPIRRLDHAHPFIAESGSGVYIPADYFHRKIEGGLRLGRFLCMPIARPQPAAKEALEALCEATEISVVSLRSLSPRELSQNTGLAVRDAEMIRQRDFEEYFFFAGATEADLDRFRQAAVQRQYCLRNEGPLWGISVGADLARAVRQTGALYDKASPVRLANVGVELNGDPSGLAATCRRGVRIVRGRNAEAPEGGRVRSVEVHSSQDWEDLVELLGRRE